jgi:hypothetical protein
MTPNLNLRRPLAGTLATFLALAISSVTTTQTSAQGSVTPPGVTVDAPQLTPSQRSAIYSAVAKENSKATPPVAFNPVVGAKVPPSIALSALPDSALAEIPAIRSYQYTVVKNDVVLVDPTTLQVIDIIRQ